MVPRAAPQLVITTCSDLLQAVQQGLCVGLPSVLDGRLALAPLLYTAASNPEACAHTGGVASYNVAHTVATRWAPRPEQRASKASPQGQGAFT